MPGSANTSFIPKHTPNKPERKNAPRQLYIGTLLVRVLFTAVLIAAITAFIYERQLSGQLAAEIQNFNSVASRYEADEERVQSILSMDLRLLQASELLSSSVSIASLFTAIERSVIGTVQITSLDITHETKEEILLAATIVTDSFDSTMFQRSIFEQSAVLQHVEIADVQIAGLDEAGSVPPQESISFSASITIDPKDIATLVVSESNFQTPPTAPAPQPVVEAVSVTEGADASGVDTQPASVNIGIVSE
jgi:hypothetical protein